MRARIWMAFVAAALVASAAARAADDAASPPTTSKAPASPQAGAKEGVKDGAKEGAKEPAPPPSVTVIGARDAHGILGREVRSAANENMGRIVDVIVDREGMVRAAVIDFGGFLGVGSRRIVVDWNALHFASVASKSDSITLELTKEQVNAAPEYKEDTPLIVLGAAGSLRPWEYDH